MASIATGIWYDNSQPRVLNAVWTLPVDQGNMLLAALAALVTLAGARFWSIIAAILHHRLVKKPNPTTVDLQHQITLRNSASSDGTLFEVFKIHRDWSQLRTKGLWKRTCALALPAAIVWSSFTAASILTSKVANKAYGTVVARISPDNCGFWFYRTQDREGYNEYLTKVLNDTIQARNYVSNFYSNTSSSPTARTAFVQPSLPYNVSIAAPCPIPATERCILGHESAFSMSTGPLDSHDMLGINAKKSDRITLDITTTCSPVHTKDLVKEAIINNGSFLQFFLGSSNDVLPNVTYLYNLLTPGTDINYALVPLYASAQGTNAWVPIPDFNRTDADVSIYFLSQNNIGYTEPVFDPWFSANGTYSRELANTTLILPDYDVNVMVCADQYTICNPTTKTCTAQGGINRAEFDAITNNKPGFGPAQFVTAGRLILALRLSSTYSSVGGLGASALWAKSRVFDSVSPSLPDNQWQTEVLGWFQTSLAKLQSYVVEYASNSHQLGPEGSVISPYNVITNNTLDHARYKAEQDQCANQLVQTAGHVQNFSFLGVMVIFSVSACLIVTSWFLECIMDRVSRRRHRFAGPAARRADDKLHLLRVALGEPRMGGDHWQLGRKWKVPVLAGESVWERPDGTQDLGAYSPAPISVVSRGKSSVGSEHSSPQLPNRDDPNAVAGLPANRGT